MSERLNKTLGCGARLAVAGSLVAAGACGTLVFFERERVARFFNSVRENFDDFLGTAPILETQRPPTCLCASETPTTTPTRARTPRPKIAFTQTPQPQLPTDTQRPPEQPTETPRPPEPTNTPVPPTETPVVVEPTVTDGPPQTAIPIPVLTP